MSRVASDFSWWLPAMEEATRFVFVLFYFESTQLARQLHQERTQMEVQ